MLPYKYFVQHMLTTEGNYRCESLFKASPHPWMNDRTAVVGDCAARAADIAHTSAGCSHAASRCRAQPALADSDVTRDQRRFLQHTHPDIEIETFVNDIDATITQFQPDFEFRITPLQQRHNRCNVTASEAIGRERHARVVRCSSFTPSILFSKAMRLLTCDVTPAAPPTQPAGAARSSTAKPENA